MEPLVLTKDNNGETIDVEINNLHRLVVPTIFCRSSKLLVFETGVPGGTYNPVEFVRYPEEDSWKPNKNNNKGILEGKFGLLTAQRNDPHPQADTRWWQDRDPMYNGEYSTWEETDPTKSNKIFIYWENLDSPPVVQYALRDDTAVFIRGAEDITLRLKSDLCGIGVRTYNCNNITIDQTDITHAGRGILMDSTIRCNITDLSMCNIANIGLTMHQNSYENKVSSAWLDTLGISKSTGSVFLASGANNNEFRDVHVNKSLYGRYWPLDGSAFQFGAACYNNEVIDSAVTNSFAGCVENSGSRGNRLTDVTMTEVTNSFDQVDSEGVGEVDDPADIITKMTCIQSGPYGVRTPPEELEGADIKTIGDYDPHKTRWVYEAYPDLPQYKGFSYRNDAINLGPPEIPSWVP
jgi:hypothetical protein